jgi:WD40 repeat protein
VLPALALAAAWAWWAWGPARPAIQWDIPASCLDRCRLTADGRTLVVLPQSGMPAIPAPGWPYFSPPQLVQLWDVATRQPRLCVPRGSANRLGDEVYHVAPDGSWLVARIGDHVSVLDGPTGAERVAFGPYRWEHAVAPDGQTLAAVDADYRIVLWDAATGRAMPLLQRRAESPLVFSRDGRTFAAFDGPDSDEIAVRRPNSLPVLPEPRLDGRSHVRVWDVATGRERAALAVPTSGTAPLLALSPDGRRVALYQTPAGGSEPALQVWEVGPAAAVTVAPFHDPPFLFPSSRHDSIKPIEYSPDGRLVALRPSGNRGHVWDVSQTPPRCLDHLLAEDRTRFWSRSVMAHASRYPIFSPDGRWVVVPGSEPGLLELRPAADLDRRTVLRLRRSEDNIQLSFSPDSRTLVAATGFWENRMGTAPEQWLHDRFGVPTLPRCRFAVQLFDTDTGAERAAWTVNGYFNGSLLGFGLDGRSVWTEVHATDPAKEHGVRAIQLWAEPSPWPPAWLVGVTALGLALAAADRWRSRRRAVLAGGGP